MVNPCTWYLQNVPGIPFFLRNTKECDHLSYISFNMVPLCYCALLSGTVKVLEMLLEAILWKPFQLFRRILNYISSITKAPVPSMLISIEGTSRNQLEPGQGIMVDAALWSLVRTPWPKPTGVLEHCEGETNCWFSIFQGVPFWPHP